MNSQTKPIGSSAATLDRSSDGTGSGHIDQVLPRPEGKNVCAVMVTYYPQGAFRDRILAVAAQVDQVVIIDNRSPSEVREVLLAMSSTPGIDVVLNSDNLGVASALNEGMNWAKARGYSWVLTLDQDSLIDKFLVARLQDICEQIEPKHTIGIIAPNFVDEYGKDVLRKMNLKGTAPWVEMPTVITSGSLISMAAFDACGLFRDDFFIDMVDTEFCLRLRAQGYRIYISRQVLMTHPIGRKTRHKLLWRQVNASNHSALRKYYITRNRLILAQRYLLREPAVVIRELLDSFYSLITIVLYETDKLNKYRAILLGMGHAVSRRTGKLDPSLHSL